MLGARQKLPRQANTEGKRCQGVRRLLWVYMPTLTPKITAGEEGSGGWRDGQWDFRWRGRTEDR